MGHGLPGADEVPRLGVRGGKIVALGQTPGRGDQHKLDTWQGLVETLAQILYESHNPVVEKLAQDALNIAQPPGAKLEP